MRLASHREWAVYLGLLHHPIHYVVRRLSSPGAHAFYRTSVLVVVSDVVVTIVLRFGRLSEFIVACSRMLLKSLADNRDS